MSYNGPRSTANPCTFLPWNLTCIHLVCHLRHCLVTIDSRLKQLILYYQWDINRIYMYIYIYIWMCDLYAMYLYIYNHRYDLLSDPLLQFHGLSPILRCSQGILGIDGPTHPESILYKERYEHFATEAWFSPLKSWRDPQWVYNPSTRHMIGEIEVIFNHSETAGLGMPYFQTHLDVPGILSCPARPNGKRWTRKTASLFCKTRPIQMLNCVGGSICFAFPSRTARLSCNFPYNVPWSWGLVAQQCHPGMQHPLTYV